MFFSICSNFIFLVSACPFLLAFDYYFITIALLKVFLCVGNSYLNFLAIIIIHYYGV